MGMYSYFQEEEIEVIDWEGLIKFLEGWKELDKDGNGMSGVNEQFNEIMPKMIDEKNKRISFSEWTDIKLISYFYPIDCVFLDCIAKYIQGNVKWSFETEEEFCEVIFENRECIIKSGEITWNEEPAKDLYNDKREKMKPNIKKFLVLNKLR